MQAGSRGLPLSQTLGDQCSSLQQSQDARRRVAVATATTTCFLPQLPPAASQGVRVVGHPTPAGGVRGVCQQPPAGRGAGALPGHPRFPGQGVPASRGQFQDQQFDPRQLPQHFEVPIGPRRRRRNNYMGEGNEDNGMFF